MTEKIFLKKMFFQSAVLLAVYFLLQISVGFIFGKEYKEDFSAPNGSPISDKEQFVAQPDTDGVIEINSLEPNKGNLRISLNGKAPGDVFLNIQNQDTGESFDEGYYRVAPDGTITNMNNGNFTNYRWSQLCMIFLICGSAIILWNGFRSSYKDLRFSYHSIFCFGFGTWVTIIGILMIYGYLRNIDMLNLYTLLQNAALYFIMLTFPALLIFTISLTVSNISLILHEGFRVRNALGIIFSLIILWGAVFAVFLDNLWTGGSDFEMDIFSSIINGYCVIYVLFECFLIGAIACGTLSALHHPDLNKDFIIILGCKIRKDGTLYPLIRSRVDTAIAFYKKQKQTTGKCAVFVPSGGKGNDEPLSEAEGMKRYLMEQGIDESAILVEDQSKNTRQNMLFSKKLIDERNPEARSVFSTTNFHVFRSGIISRQVGFDIDGMGSPTKWYFWPNAYIREMLGMLSYKWKSLVLILIPILAFLIVIQFSF